LKKAPIRSKAIAKRLHWFLLILLAVAP
jgi:hypothetical protein